MEYKAERVRAEAASLQHPLPNSLNLPPQKKGQIFLSYAPNAPKRTRYNKNNYPNWTVIKENYSRIPQVAIELCNSKYA